MKASVTAIAAFSDNYIWLISKLGCAEAVVVDPGDPAPVVAELERRKLTLKALLITHRHTDHTGGIYTLLNRYPGLTVYGPKGENIPHRNQPVAEGHSVRFDQLGLEFKVMEVPGHTRGHIAYHEPRRQWLFCGDTLFAAGCGRVFCGTHAQLHQSLSRIASLPPATQAYCAHEYTLDNIGFARLAEPGNANLTLFEAECRQKRHLGIPTVPNTIRRELLFNPFLRLDQPPVIAAARAWAANPQCELNDLDPAEPEHTFHLIRNWKDKAYD
ncbi:MAG: hydroxyacylglutathione hydrolase [Gammaproteobacteria bacterium]|nr:hydroxyacylglutathione hydrolase [Pseudomonadota bacterium]MCH9662908.1 hydroxyacylglutathione hydrolase [Gammaproteobacteria bacterium]